MNEKQDFEGWAIVSVMGHQTFAGRVSTQTLGGGSLLRIDIPAVRETPAWTHMVGMASIYSLTPVSEEVARERAAALLKQPLSVYDLPEETKAAIRAGRQVLLALPVPSPAEAAVDDNDDSEDSFSEVDDDDYERGLGR